MSEKNLLCTFGTTLETTLFFGRVLSELYEKPSFRIYSFYEGQELYLYFIRCKDDKIYKISQFHWDKENFEYGQIVNFESLKNEEIRKILKCLSKTFEDLAEEKKKEVHKFFERDVFDYRDVDDEDDACIYRYRKALSTARRDFEIMIKCSSLSQKALKYSDKKVFLLEALKEVLTEWKSI